MHLYLLPEGIQANEVKPKDWIAFLLSVILSTLIFSKWWFILMFSVKTPVLDRFLLSTVTIAALAFGYHWLKKCAITGFNLTLKFWRILLIAWAVLFCFPLLIWLIAFIL